MFTDFKTLLKLLSKQTTQTDKIAEEIFPVSIIDKLLESKREWFKFLVKIV